MIYLDHNATTPMRAEVFETLRPFLQERFGNPSSFYGLARQARAALADARRNLAALIGAQPEEIIFTSGGTEADNLALRGTARMLKGRGRHIVTTAIEHHAVLRTCRDLEQEGFTVTYVPARSDGQVAVQDVLEAVRTDTILVSVMLANNETGVIQPVAAIAAGLRERDIALHCDAVQALGKIPLDVNALGVSLLALSGHKVYGPKGAGALYVRPDTPLAPILTGGSQESGRRAGTENVAAWVGFATAAGLACRDMETEGPRLKTLRDRFEALVTARIPRTVVHGASSPRLPNTAHISFANVESESVLLHLDLRGICASAGSACTTGSPEPSHVLAAMGIPALEAQSALRFSLGRGTTAEDMSATAAALADIIDRLRAISSC